MSELRSEHDRSRVKEPVEVMFDGSSLTATTSDASATISINGHSVSASDVGEFLVIRGGRNFVIGAYRIVLMDADSNTWMLDRPCTTGAGAGMTGTLVSQEGRWHDPVPEYFDDELPDNPGQGEARQGVLEALNFVEPGILRSLAETCLKRALLDPASNDEHDWPGPFDELLWGHVKDAGRFVPPIEVVSGNLVPLEVAIVRWANDEPQHRWSLCGNDGQPLDWIADAAVQTLVYWLQRGRLPKNLRWENLDFHCYRSLDSEDAFEMLAMEQDFDAGAGYLRIAPEFGIDFSRLSDREQRAAKKEYKLLGQKQELTRMQRVSARYSEWYALQTFLGSKLREIRERELGTRRKAGIGTGVGDPQDPEDLSAIAHGIKTVADLVGFRR
jgi:hypothetical protein